MAKKYITVTHITSKYNGFEIISGGWSVMSGGQGRKVFSFFFNWLKESKRQSFQKLFSVFSPHAQKELIKLTSALKSRGREHLFCPSPPLWKPKASRRANITAVMNECRLFFFFFPSVVGAHVSLCLPQIFLTPSRVDAHSTTSSYVLLLLSWIDASTLN